MKMPWAVSGPQVVQAGLVLDRAEEGLQQAVEFLRLGPGAAGAAVRAGDVGQPVLRQPALLLGELLLQVVGAEPPVADGALDQRVDERRDVAGGHPHLAGQDDRGIQADDVVAGADHRVPPLPLDVVLEFDAERAVVPRRPGAAVDLAAGVDEPPSLGEGDNGVDAVAATTELLCCGPGAVSGHRAMSPTVDSAGFGQRRVEPNELRVRSGDQTCGDQPAVPPAVTTLR